MLICFYNKIKKRQWQGFAIGFCGCFTCFFCCFYRVNQIKYGCLTFIACTLSLWSQAATELHKHADIYAAAGRFIEQQTGKQAHIKPLNKHLRIAKCQVPLDIDFPFNNRKTVRAICSQPIQQDIQPWKLHLQVKLTQDLRIWRTNKQLPIGTLIQPDDVTLAVYVGHDYGQLLPAHNSPVGHFSKHALTNNQWLKKTDISTNMQVWQSKVVIPADTVIETSMLQPVTLAKHLFSANNVETNLDKIIGKVSRYNLEVGHTINKQDITGRQRVVVAASNLVPNRPIIADDLILAWRLDYQLSRPALQDKDNVIGKVPNSLILKGQSINASLIRRPYLVVKGSIVKLVKRTKNLTVSSDVRVLSNGNKGDRIAVEVLSSGEKRYGLVITKGVLQLTE